MDGLSSSGFSELDRLAALFQRTRAVLGELVMTGSLPQGGESVLAQESLPHVEDVEAGFRSSLRAGEAVLSELRLLVLQGGLGLPGPRDGAEERAALIEAMQAARSGTGRSQRITPSPARRLAALAHARLVFAMLPRTPADQVRFPGPLPSYADIPAPRTPGELSERIEELERQLWRVASGHLPRRDDAAYRRVYGYFDTGERLTAAFHA